MPDDTLHRTLAPAKLNLSLRVLAREASGYHQIETLFCALELADEVAISRTRSGVTLAVAKPAGTSQTAPDLGPLEQNLAFRAAALFTEARPFDHGIHVHLTKHIPAGAGLGGGSSDAAAVLRALNALHGRPLTQQELLEIGARLGADVPFLLSGAALALAWGRGERILPLPPLDAAAVVLAVPPERVSTAAAYAALDPTRPVHPEMVSAPRTWRDVVQSSRNDFEDVIFAQHPRLEALRQTLEGAGALLARMTGTGSAIFGVFADVAAAQTAAAHIAAAEGDVDTIVTLTAAERDAETIVTRTAAGGEFPGVDSNHH